MNEQTDLFEHVLPKYKIDKPVRLIELFAGIGSQAAALRNLGIEFEHYRVVEWDKYAIASYNAIHGTNFETSDITKIHAEDLGIREREILLHNDLFVSMPGLKPCRESERDEKRERHTFGIALGS